MRAARICDECQAELPGDAPEGLCPQCLLKSAGAELGISVRKREASSREAGLPAGPRKFGNYEILEGIGQGGMGAVYKARQLNLDRVVALKLLPFGQFSRREVVQRFHAEANAAAALQHPNIVAVHDVGECDGQPFFSMDYVEGRTLAELVRDQPLPARRAASYLKTIAAAVHYAHRQGILHRDLKPSNVLIDAFDQPRITDFGLAKRLSGDSDLTLTGQILGSPSFISPEQAEGRSEAIGPASDIYSLGALLYHLLTRQPPFQADTLTTLLRQVIENEPVAPRLLNPGIPKDLETICLKCLEKEPARRYGTALALAEDLGRFLNGEPILARPVSVAVKAWKWCRARPALAGMTAALLLTLAAGFTAVLWQLQRVRAGESAARANSYAADMSLAQAAVEKGDLGAALVLLNAHRPTPGQRDLRGWEWRYLWQQCQSDEQSELTRSPAVVDSVAFSPDGRWLAVRDELSTLTLWDAKSRQRVSSFKMFGYLNPFAFSQRGNLLGYACAGTQAVSIVNLDTRQEMARFPRTRNVVRLAFSADAGKVVILEEDGSLTQWEINTKQRLAIPASPPGVLPNPLKAVVFSPDGSLLTLEAETGFVLCEPETGRRARFQFSAPASAPSALCFSADGKLLAAGIGGSDSEVYVWTVEDLWRSPGTVPPPRGKYGKHRDWICAVAFSPDGRALASASADSTLRVWELDRPGAGRRYQGHQHQVLTVAWSTDGRTIASGGRDGSVRIWDPWHEPAASGPQVLPLATWNWCFRLSADGKTAIAVEPTNRAVVLWDVMNARLAETLAFAGTNNYVAVWSPDGGLLAVGDEVGNLRVWDLASRRAVATMRVPGLVGFLDFSPNGRFLSCGAATMPTWETFARLWQVDGWREIPVPPKATEKLAWGGLSPDGRLLVTLHFGGALNVWDLRTGRCRARLSQPLAGSARQMGWVTFSPDGRYWTSSTPNGVLAIWDTKGRQPPTIIPRSAQELWNTSFFPDSTRLVVSGRRAADAVRLLDLRSKRFVVSLRSEADLYANARTSADGNMVYAVGQKAVLLWHAPSWAEIEAAEKKQP